MTREAMKKIRVEKCERCMGEVFERDDKMGGKGVLKCQECWKIEEISLNGRINELEEMAKEKGIGDPKRTGEGVCLVR